MKVVGSHGWMWVPMVGCRFPWLDDLKAILRTICEPGGKPDFFFSLKMMVDAIP